MVEIFKIFYQFLNKGKKGSVLILAILILGLMIFLATYFVSFSLTGSQMANNQKYATQAYYLAEAGVQEAIFRLKNDVLWKSAFETLPTTMDPNCTSWSIPNYQRTGGVLSGGAYQISINNLGCAKAEIVVQATVDISPTRKAQRVVKVKVFKAMGNPVAIFGIFTGGASGNSDIRLTGPLRVHDGDLFIKNNLQVRSFSNILVDKKALIGNNVNIDGSSHLNSSSICSSNICQAGCDPSVECPPKELEMPPVDFDSSSLNSLSSRAQVSDCASLRNDGKTNCLFTTSEFEKVLWNNYPVIVFPTGTVAYVQGDVNIRAGQQLIVIGVLASGRDINLGINNCWSRSEYPFLRCGFSAVHVFRPSDSLKMPAGLLAKRKFSSGGFLGIGSKSLTVNGLIYAGDALSISSVLAPIKVYGGIVARMIDFSSIWQDFDIYLDPDAIIDTLGVASYSPVIVVDHWEEEY